MFREAFQSRGMADMYTWIVFQAHPTAEVAEEDFHPDFLGTFVTPELRTQPEELLAELLRNRKISLIEMNKKQLKSRAEDWGMHEKLKKQVDQEGYGLALIKLHARPIEVD